MALKLKQEALKEEAQFDRAFTLFSLLLKEVQDSKSNSQFYDFLEFKECLELLSNYHMITFFTNMAESDLLKGCSHFTSQQWVEILDITSILDNKVILEILLKNVPHEAFGRIHLKKVMFDEQKSLENQYPDVFLPGKLFTQEKKEEPVKVLLKKNKIFLFDEQARKEQEQMAQTKNRKRRMQNKKKSENLEKL